MNTNPNIKYNFSRVATPVFKMGDIIKFLNYKDFIRNRHIPLANPLQTLYSLNDFMLTQRIKVFIHKSGCLVGVHLRAIHFL